jgi:hypothetical protein
MVSMRSGQSVICHVVGHIGHQSLPLGVEDGCQGGLGRDLVNAAVLLVGAVFVKSAV